MVFSILKLVKKNPQKKFKRSSKAALNSSKTTQRQLKRRTIKAGQKMF